MANFNFNKVILGGRLTQDPELRTSQSGTTFVRFSVAVSRRPSRNDVSGQTQADFFNCSAFGTTAEFISRYFRKGSSICVTGRIQNDNYTDQQGVKHYSTNIMVEEVQFVDSRAESGNAFGGNAQSAPQAAPTGYVPDNYGYGNAVQSPAFSNAPKFEEITDDDELPF